MKYIIVAKDVTSGMNGFLIKVNAKIKDGYIPCGGITHREDSFPHRDYFYQAMIKKEKK